MLEGAVIVWPKGYQAGRHHPPQPKGSVLVWSRRAVYAKDWHFSNSRLLRGYQGVEKVPAAGAGG